MGELLAPTFMRALQAVQSGKGGQLAKVLSPRTPCLTLSPAVIDLVLSVTEPPDALAPFAPLPAEHCWIEFCGGLQAMQETTPIQAMLLAPGILLVAMMDSWMAFSREETQLAFDRENTQIALGSANGEDVARLMRRIFVTLCAVLATPGVRSTDEQRRERRLQRANGSASPVVTYRCIDVNLDAMGDIPESASGGGLGGGYAGMALHHVRGHLRLTEKGLIPVRPHWRGNAANGIRFRDHNIKRDEEMH